MLHTFGDEIWIADGTEVAIAGFHYPTRMAVARVLAWPAEKVVMAHGTPIDKDAQAYLRRAFAWLIA